MLKKITNYFTKGEIALWVLSVTLIVASFAAFGRESYITLAASIIGVTSLIFNAKGNSIGQLLIIIFSLFYGYISYSFAYYGEMITYLGMSAPMAAFALVSWLKNPYNGNKAEVKINKLSVKEILFMIALTAVITFVFYFILEAFDTANIVPSTISVATSFLAVYMTFRRSPGFALGYAMNDIVLIWLWILAAMEDISYVSMIICFAVFLVNDIYGFVCWVKREKRQSMEMAAVSHD